MTHSSIDIKYSLEEEVKRVIHTYKRIEWYVEHGYAPQLRLPHGCTVKVIPSADEIQHILSNEYDDKLYSQYASNLQIDFNKYSNLINRAKCPITFLENYILILTKYGTGGSYVLPNTIIINIEKNSSGISVLFHEMIHLSIEEMIKKYSLTQNQKERIVDLLFKKIFPSIKSEQKRFNNQTYIDYVFNTEYPNIEKVFEKIKHIN